MKGEKTKTVRNVGGKKSERKKIENEDPRYKEY